MDVLVVYATRHGATREIAERIAEKLTAAGHEAEACPARAVGSLAGYDAYVVGSGVYARHWLADALDLVRRNHAVLAGRPVWLFSSGPLGTKATAASGRDLREAAEPKEIAGIEEAVHPRGHRLFPGALNPRKLGLAERAVRRMPSVRARLPEGDFRNWAEIEHWADEIANDLALTIPGSSRV